MPDPMRDPSSTRGGAFSRREVAQLFGLALVMAACSSDDSGAPTTISSGTNANTTVGPGASTVPGSTTSTTIAAPLGTLRYPGHGIDLPYIDDAFTGLWAGSFSEEGGAKGAAVVTVTLDQGTRVATLDIQIEQGFLGLPATHDTFHVELADEAGPIGTGTSETYGHVALTVAPFQAPIQVLPPDGRDVEAKITIDQGITTFSYTVSASGTTRRGLLRFGRNDTVVAQAEIPDAAALASGAFAVSVLRTDALVGTFGGQFDPPVGSTDASAPLAPGVTGRSSCHAESNPPGVKVDLTVYVATDAAGAISFVESKRTASAAPLPRDAHGFIDGTGVARTVIGRYAIEIATDPPPASAEIILGLVRSVVRELTLVE